MVEIADAEVIFSREELDVRLLGDIEELGAVAVRAARGWGRTPLHVHARHAEALFVLEGELALQLEDRMHRIGPETWAFVPSEVVHTFEVTGDELARFFVFHTPGSGFGDYVRGRNPGFDQHPPPEYATGDPGLVVIRRTGGAEGEKIADQPDRRSTILVDADELTVSEFMRGAGVRGAERHVHYHHADAFLVVEGELTFALGSSSLRGPAGTFVVFPPNVVHGFDNDSAESALFYNLHMPASGFADYLRGRNPGFDQHDPPADGGVDPATAILTRLSG